MRVGKTKIATERNKWKQCLFGIKWCKALRLPFWEKNIVTCS